MLFLFLLLLLSIFFIENALKFLETVCKFYPFDEVENGKISDKDGKTPYHIVMERKYNQHLCNICKILSNYPINPICPDSHGKRPGEGRKNDDKRCAILQEKGKEFQKSQKKNSKKSKSGASKSHAKKGKGRNTASSEPSKSDLESSNMQQQQQQPQATALDSDSILQGVKEMLDILSEKPPSYFEPPANYKRQASSTASNQPRVLSPTVSIENEQSTTPAHVKECGNEPQDIDIDEINKNFEDCPWEVECTEKVKRFLVNTKIPLSERKAAVKKIKVLANGIQISNQKLCKEVRTDSKTDSKLYRAKFTKGGRIIWEIAVQFSPRLTQPFAEGDTKKERNKYIFTQVIRLWDIVLDHDNLTRAIDHVVDRIRKSQSRGEKAAIQIQLNMGKDQRQHTKDQRQHTRGQEQLLYPQCYTCDESESISMAVRPQFTPAGSTKEDEYNVITFYSFDSSFVKSMLGGDNARRDFPFKEWHKEHDIISMPEGKVSILLLGRSGTGKTTCCLYRLWNQFQNYWLKTEISEPLVPRKKLAILDDGDNKTDNLKSNSHTDAELADDLQEEKPNGVTEPSDPELEHYHQIFITKNYVLCAQMKKRFYDLAASRDMANDHMPYEEVDVPNSLSDIQDLAYPLFLTARQFFLLLDNSLGSDNKNFFARDEEGRLKEKLLSSDYDHEDPDTLLDLEESDSEEDDFEFDDEVHPKHQTVKRKLRERREVTASYFAEVIWPKISKNVTLQNAKIDPLLVWMEIKSFIKGSSQAAETESGFLSLEEYECIGKKMAPNYSDNREDIYKIFQLYKDYIQQNRKEDNIFDECDLIHSIYTRFNSLKDLPWSIHSIYIDEVQDFTQAELSILIRICRDPNNLFLTGDTAQSIMRGISFRFSDLRSLFHCASNQVAKKVRVQVPEVNELTINFRSHTGILRLAASVIDLMKHFFPSSFDRLPGDEGMFEGPIPMVLDSCNISDLALVLRGNKRESSAIEFGAHQVIIVQSEEAKKNIPDVLKAGIVLTVFESKGLEFDDVLLYDFFKYSQVGNSTMITIHH